MENLTPEEQARYDRSVTWVIKGIDINLQRMERILPLNMPDDQELPVSE